MYCTIYTPCSNLKVVKCVKLTQSEDLVSLFRVSFQVASRICVGLNSSLHSLPSKTSLKLQKYSFALVNGTVILSSNSRTKKFSPDSVMRMSSQNTAIKGGALGIGSSKGQGSVKFLPNDTTPFSLNCTIMLQ